MSAPPNAPYGWCPSVLRPMPLDDGLMIRIRPWLGVLNGDQARGLADIAARHGAGGIELTNRANLQLRGLSQADFDAILPKLEALGLARVDHTPSARVNLTVEPLRVPGTPTASLSEALSDALAAPEFGALPQKFGFLIDTGAERVMADIVGDIRIEASGGQILVRPAGRDTGRLADGVASAVALACDLARWFIGAGAIGADGRGRMAEAIARGLTPPDALTGTAVPNAPAKLDMTGPGWVSAMGDTMAPDTLAQAAEAAPLHVSPFRALFAPRQGPTRHLETPGQRRDNAGQPARTLSGPA